MEKLNIGLLAHVDAGKTTLTEQLCFQAGALRKAGSVDEGTAQSDFLSVERQRGISVRASTLILETKSAEIHLIDTPGHVDFAAEVERALSVLDAAVLIISSAEGIQAQTELLYEALCAQQIPVLFFLNKLDRVGSDAKGVIEEIARKWNPRLLPLCRWEGEGERGCTVSPRSPLEEQLLETLALADDHLLESYLSGEKLPEERLWESLRRQTAQGILHPLLAGSAMLGEGIRELLACLEKAVSPRARQQALGGVVYQITHDRTAGKVAHVRLFGGQLRTRDILPCSSNRQEQKITQLRRYHGGRFQDVQQIGPGDVAGLCGIDGIRVGDIIGELPARQGVPLSAPLLKTQVLPGPKADMHELICALTELSEEDPGLRIDYLPGEEELDLSFTGPVQLEILSALAAERYGLPLSFSPPGVIYKETPSRAGNGREAYTMPKPCWAIIELAIEPLPRGSGFQFFSTVPNDQIFYRYQNHIREELPRALQQGLFNWEVIDLKVTLCGGSHHTVHTHPLDFFLATPMALMDALKNTGTTLLEPVQQLRIAAPEHCAGRILGDMVEMRGEYDSPLIRDGRFFLDARVPVASSLDYPVRLAALSSGQAVLSTRFDSYQPCPPGAGKAARRYGVNPLDREKWILSHRSATQG
ncbi:MAG: TetM/TetW/TetO/TetS family tetracycline resistance ribosomal protection protein [Provencibacterium sp.]|jgi:ribosomal protection tetracycline resistance protein|nr:TetM/TetW/TetO/TetS family tetracycline resistance ribosomal protection protein [Provencibacterium sp.]